MTSLPIAARGLTKRYGATVAVDGLTFDVVPGAVTGFLGPNGAGKSTTLRMILGLDAPTAGTVTIGGRAYRDLPAPAREVGALLDAKAGHPRHAARDHLLWQAQAAGLPRRRVGEVLDLVGLGDVGGRRLGQLSLGMAQRLGIAGALLGNPGILLFDEPMNGLDPEGIHWIRRLLRGFADEGRTVVVSSHLMHEMEATADRVLVVGRGRLLADTTLADFTRRAAGAHVRVVSPDAGALARLLRDDGGRIADEPDGALRVEGLLAAEIGDVAAAHGLRVHELTPRSATLESAFIERSRDSVEFQPEAVA